MSRCVQFHHLYDKDAEACGMSPQSESYYKRYREAVRKLVGQKLDEDFIYENFKEGAYRVILSIKDEDARTDALSYVSECLHNGEKVTERDLRGWFKVWKIEHCESEKSTNVKLVTSNTDVKEPVPETPILSLAQQQAGKKWEIHNSPEILAKLGKPAFDSPFKTGAEVQAHDKDPLGIDKNKAGQPVMDAIINPSTLKERRIQLADDLLATYSERTQMEVRDLMKKNPSWKTAADVFYFGVEALVNPPKITVAPAHGGMRR
jgi:hypothetical protein